MPQEFNIKSDDAWNKILIADNEELRVGARVYNGERTMLVSGVETTIAELVWGGSHILENGKVIEVVDGIITEINDIPQPQASMRDKVKALKEQRKIEK